MGSSAAIFVDAQTRLRKPTNLKALTSNIDQLDWFSAREEGLGNLYEGLLEKNASDKKVPALASILRPRPLIDCIVRLMQPQAGETVQDPGSGKLRASSSPPTATLRITLTISTSCREAQAFFQRHNAFVGSELRPRHASALHDEPSAARYQRAVWTTSTRCRRTARRCPRPISFSRTRPLGPRREVVRPTRSDFSVTADTSNKQLAFVEHIVRALKPGGRRRRRGARQRAVRGQHGPSPAHLDHGPDETYTTILRLPTGIFYAQGVKTNVLFLQRGKTDKANTQGGVGLRHACQHARLRQDPVRSP